MKAKQVNIKLRLRDDLEMHEKLVAAAKKNGRTLNAELCARLHASFEPQNISEIVEMTLSAWHQRRFPFGYGSASTFGHSGYLSNIGPTIGGISQSYNQCVQQPPNNWQGGKK